VEEKTERAMRKSDEGTGWKRDTVPVSQSVSLCHGLLSGSIHHRRSDRCYAKPGGPDKMMTGFTVAMSFQKIEELGSVSVPSVPLTS
jgi:hypothetical protein